MRYEEVKLLISRELAKHPNGLTWKELKTHLKLPYKSLCPEWSIQLEDEIGLIRQSKSGRAHVWSLSRKGNHA